MVNKTAALLN